MPGELLDLPPQGFALRGLLLDTPLQGFDLLGVPPLFRRCSVSYCADNFRKAAVSCRSNSVCTAPGFLDTRLRYAAWRSSYSSRASSGVRYASFSRRQHWL